MSFSEGLFHGDGIVSVDDNGEYFAHVSDRPWGAITESDYTLGQWHNACLIHQHEGPPTSKSQCKLPVKTPNGALNRNGVHAAAAALAGARGGVNASSDEKTKAARSLVRYYGELGEDPPASIQHSDEYFEHFGVKGMHWGVRRDRTPHQAPSTERKRADKILEKKQTKGTGSLTNKELGDLNKRLQLEKSLKDLQRNPNKLTVKKGHEAVKEVLAIGGTLGAVLLFSQTDKGKAVTKALGLARPKGSHYRPAKF